MKNQKGIISKTYQAASTHCITPIFTVQALWQMLKRPKHYKRTKRTKRTKRPERPNAPSAHP